MTVTTDSTVIGALRSTIKGRLILPQDADYDKARTIFYGGIDRHPMVIVKVADDADVARVVTVAREHGAELAVRSGGHSGPGHSVSEGGIVLDLGAMKKLEIDPEGHTAWAETGLTAAELVAALDKYDLGIGFGDTGSVGIGGITLGGGVGYLVRKYGLTIDSLLAADIVTADGQLRRVDAEHEPDLFWAIRGGGGNFGVATRFKYQLRPVGQVTGGMLMLPATAETVAAFIAASEAAPEELSAIGNVMTAPPMPFLPEELHGKLCIMALLMHVGTAEEGEKAIAPFRAIATPLADFVQPMRYPAIYEGEDTENYHPKAGQRTMFIDTIDGAVAETIMAHLNALDAPMRVAQLRVLGGAMARVPKDATAFAHRQRHIMVNVASIYEDPADHAVRQAWADDFAAALQQGTADVYVNFLMDEGEAQIQAAYPGATWDRLRAIKARYDPTNLFHMNQNIPPANG